MFTFANNFNVNKPCILHIEITGIDSSLLVSTKYKLNIHSYLIHNKINIF